MGVSAYLALGANLDDRLANLQRAVDLLSADDAALLDRLVDR